MRTASLVPVPLTLVVALGAACVFVHATDGDPAKRDAHARNGARAGQGASARAALEARSGSSVAGEARFTEVAGGVRVEIDLHHAPPGWHAVHLHEVGDCSAADASSAGAHFNPGGKGHGAPHAAERHAGDFGNLWVDEKGAGHHLVLVPELTVADGPYSVRGRALIVHASVDDLVTQPTGNAGGRIACGVVR